MPTTLYTNVPNSRSDASLEMRQDFDMVYSNLFPLTCVYFPSGNAEWAAWVPTEQVNRCLFLPHLPPKKDELPLPIRTHTNPDGQLSCQRGKNVAGTNDAQKSKEEQDKKEETLQLSVSHISLHSFVA